MPLPRLHPAFWILSSALALSGCHHPNGAPQSLGATSAEHFAAGSRDAAQRYASANWKLVWHDEFDAGTLPSPERWSYERGQLRNHERQYYTAGRAENARVTDGNLVITARSEPWEGADVTSASLTTKGRFPIRYGKLEVSAKIPTGRGTWPAIWMLGDTSRAPWPSCGEIDMMENVGFDPEKVHFTVHTGAFNHRIGTQRSNAVIVPKVWADFHRYGVIWTPEKLEFFLDGEKVHEFANDGQGPEHWPFDQPHYLILNLAIGGDWGGQKGVDPAILPAEYRIDYVRYWQPAP